MTKKETRTRVYCGPSVRGVARQYTCFTGELPDGRVGIGGTEHRTHCAHIHSGPAQNGRANHF